MAYTTNFPTSKETFDTRAASDTIHEDDHNHIGATVEALEDKVGVDGSAVVTSHSYLLTHLPAQAQNWDIGAYTLRAQKLIADGLTTGRVVFTTTDGELTSDADMTFNTDTLTVTKIAAYTLTGKLTAGAVEIEGSNFDINGGDISAGTISGSLTWSAAQNLNSQALTNVNIDSGTIDGVTITSPTIATGIALPASAVDAITEIAAALKSGSDTTLVTGTKGTTNYISKWNADGDLVDGYALIDDDSMATASATNIPSAESVKAYVDNSVPALGSWVDKSASYAAQQAATDGFVIALTSTNGQLSLYTDGNANPTTKRSACVSVSGFATGTMMPVKSGNYWKVVVDGGTVGAIYWIPLS
jgi:hypothetical protein